MDDELPIFNVIKHLLKPEGYHVISALTGEEALIKLKTNKVDLVLIDLLLPGMSGSELCEEIRMHPDLKSLNVGFLSVVKPSKLAQKRFASLNVLDYIEKPFENNELIERVKKMLND